MKTFIAKNARQVDICMKMLFLEGIRFTVKPVQTEKLKIIFNIEANVDGEEATKLWKKYIGLIS